MSQLYDLNLERSLLGGVLHLPQHAYELAAEHLIADSFYDRRNGAIFRLMGRLHDRGTPPGLAILIEALGDNLEKIGGMDTIQAMLDSVLNASQVAPHAKRIAELHHLRRLVEGLNLALQECGREATFNSIGQAVREIVLTRTEHATGADMQSLAHCLDGFLEDLTKRSDEIDRRVAANEPDLNVTRGLATGFYELDEISGGLKPGELTIVASRPGQGKSAIATNILAAVCGPRRQTPAVLFSLEMSAKEIAERMVCSGTMAPGVSTKALNTPRLEQGQWNELSRSFNQLGKAPCWICDRGTLQPQDIRALIGEAIRKNAIELAIVDYLQLIAPPFHAAKLNLTGQVTAISREMKLIAKDYNLPLIVLCQLNREIDKRGTGARPRLSDLRESGAIEQDADRVIFIHHPPPPKPTEKDPHPSLPLSELVIAKQRNGPLGTIQLLWEPEFTRFRNPARQGELS